MKGFNLKACPYWSAICQRNPKRDLHLNGRCSESGAIISNLSCQGICPRNEMKLWCFYASFVHIA